MSLLSPATSLSRSRCYGKVPFAGTLAHHPRPCFLQSLFKAHPGRPLQNVAGQRDIKNVYRHIKRPRRQILPLEFAACQFFKVGDQIVKASTLASADVEYPVLARVRSCHGESSNSVLYIKIIANHTAIAPYLDGLIKHGLMHEYRHRALRSGDSLPFTVGITKPENAII